MTDVVGADGIGMTSKTFMATIDVEYLIENEAAFEAAATRRHPVEGATRVPPSGATIRGFRS
jgi:hypothetical protein